MKINWFPGHMTKAVRMMQAEIKNIDAIIYVLDARAILSTVNPILSDLAGDRPILYVLNKADLADDTKTNEWLDYFTRQDKTAITLTSTESGQAKKIANILRTLCASKIQKYKNKGLNIVIKAMVVGVPNSGKSTLINNFCGAGKTVTGDKAGVTRGKQWINIGNGIEVMDTPGTLWPSFDNERIGENLVFIGSISDDVVDQNEVAISLIKVLCSQYPSDFIKRYPVDITKPTLEVLEDIAKARHFLVKGGDIDYDRASRTIIDDFRKGRIGKISLDWSDHV